MTRDATSLHRRIWYAVLLTGGLVAYANSFDGVFLFDDERNVVENLRIHDLSGRWREILSGSRPVVDLSLAVNYWISGKNTFGYHVVNVAVHLLAGLTLFGILRRALGLVQAGSPHHNGVQTGSLHHSIHLAGFISLIWLVHPLQTQAVTYIVQRAESMMGLFYLLTLYCVIRGATAGDSRGKASPWFVAAVVACGLGMGSKGVMVTAPIVVFLFDYVFLSGNVVESLRRRWGLYSGLAATWGVLALIGLIRQVLLPGANSQAAVGFGYTGVGSWEYLRSQPGVILHYLYLTFWPRALCLDYQWPVAQTLGEVLPAGFMLAALLGCTVWGLVRRRWWGFAGAWFFLILAPTSSFIPIKDLAFEHRMYLPLAGVLTVGVMLGRRLAGRLRQGDCLWKGGASYQSRDREGAVPGTQKERFLTVAALIKTCSSAYMRLLAGMSEHAPRRAGWGIGGTLVLALMVRTHLRNEDYRSGVRMWQSVVDLQPTNARAHSDLGIALMREGRIDEALPWYEKSMALDPAYFQAPFNMGNAMMKLKKPGEAIRWFEAALAIEPSYPRAHINLGTLLGDQGKYREAAKHFEAALRVQPKQPEALGNLGTALLGQALHAKLAAERQSLLAQAIGRLNEAISVSPQTADYHGFLGMALQQRGDLDAAESACQRALALNPQNAPARQTLKEIIQTRRSKPPGASRP